MISCYKTNKCQKYQPLNTAPALHGYDTFRSFLTYNDVENWSCCCVDDAHVRSLVLHSRIGCSPLASFPFNLAVISFLSLSSMLKNRPSLAVPRWWSHSSVCRTIWCSSLVRIVSNEFNVWVSKEKKRWSQFCFVCQMVGGFTVTCYNLYVSSQSQIAFGKRRSRKYGK